MDILDTTTKSKKRILNRFVPVIGRMPLLSSLKRCIFDVQSYNRNGIEPKNELDRLIVDILNDGSLQQYGYWLYSCIDLVQENLDEIKKFEDVKNEEEEKNNSIISIQQERNHCMDCKSNEEKIKKLQKKLDEYLKIIQERHPQYIYKKIFHKFVQYLKKNTSIWDSERTKEEWYKMFCNILKHKYENIKPITFRFWLKLLKQYAIYKKHRNHLERSISHLDIK